MSLSLQILTLPEGEAVTRREVLVSSFPFVIGRDFDSDLSLPDGSATLSRRHLQIEGNPFAGYRATDLSTNGAMLNGASMKQQGARPIADGDILEFSGYRILISVSSPQSASDHGPDPDKPPTPRQMSLSELENDKYEVPPKDDGADWPFGGDIAALEANLLFDPFEDGPGLRDTPISDARKEQPAPSSAEDGVQIVSHLDLPDSATGPAGRVMSMGLTTPAAQDLWSPTPEREELSDAIDRAIARFLDQFDPVALEKEYRDFLGPFARRKRRYWSVFQKQFRRRRENGDYGRVFRAILAEEIRRK